jgi:hypothetical protein
VESPREIEIYEGGDGKFYYRVYSPNNREKTLDGGQGFATKQGAIKAAKRELTEPVDYTLVYTEEDGHGGKIERREELKRDGTSQSLDELP